MARDHYSIGEVLALLQHDFPDVTISKIRFLESQGLIDPERTPSGYRRFVEHDLQRLRWILVQQRDHYLPLKVIRERLDAGEPVLAGSPTATATMVASASAGSDDARDHPGAPSSVLEEPMDDSGDDSADDIAVRAASDVDFPDVGFPATVSPNGTPEPEAQPAQPATSNDQVPLDAGSSGATPSVRPAVVRPPDPETPFPEAPAELAPAAESGRVALTRDELAVESGLDVPTITALERFGLLKGRPAGASVLYNGDALATARLAARFAEHGLEPRHLRAIRQAAEREIGLFAQVVGPLLQRRDTAAHERAAVTLDELIALAADLHGLLARRLADDEIGPG
jgi:DNA-binding transcriptional MerR regulator